MTRTARMSTIVKVQIPDRSLAQSFLQRWLDREDVSVNLIRGRVSPEGAWLKLEVRGTPSGVSGLLRQAAAWNLAATGALA